MLYITLPLPYSACPQVKEAIQVKEWGFASGGVCLTAPLPLTASLAPMPSARAISVDLKRKHCSLSWFLCGMGFVRGYEFSLELCSQVKA